MENPQNMWEFTVEYVLKISKESMRWRSFGGFWVTRFDLQYISWKEKNMAP
jgi:hypothetical protein